MNELLFRAAVIALPFVRDHAQPFLFGAGAVSVIIGVILLVRFLRSGEAHTRVGTLAVALATAFTAEGMWEVARNSLRLGLVMSVGLFAMFEVTMLSQGLLAKYKLSKNPNADVRRHMNFVWLLAIASGVITATAGNSLTEVLLRLVAPAVAGGIWWMTLTAEQKAAVLAKTSWIWTPRRIGIHFGLIQPGEQDLVEVDRDRRIDRLTVTAHRLHHGSGRLARFRRARLRRLALRADDAMVEEARRRVNRVHRIETLTRPGSPLHAEVVPDDVRELCDEIKLQTRTARLNLTAGANRWAAIERPPGQPALPASDDLGALVDVVSEPARWPATATPEPTAEPTTKRITVPATAGRKPATRKTTRPATKTPPDARVAAAYDALVAGLGREPSGAELATEARVSKSYANTWKRNRTTEGTP